MTQELRKLVDRMEESDRLLLPKKDAQELLDRVEKAEKDAARYRWLRSPDTDVSLVIDKRTGWVPPDEHVEGVGGYHTYEYRAGEELDTAIDSAMEVSK